MSLAKIGIISIDAGRGEGYKTIHAKRDASACIQDVYRVSFKWIEGENIS